MADGGKDSIEPEKSKTGGDEEEQENIDNNSGNEAVDGLDAEKSNKDSLKEGDEEEEKNLDSEVVNGLQV